MGEDKNTTMRNKEVLSGLIGRSI